MTYWVFLYMNMDYLSLLKVLNIFHQTFVALEIKEAHFKIAPFLFLLLKAGGNFSPLQGPNGASVSFSSQKCRGPMRLGPLEFFYLSSPHWVSSNSLIIAQVSLHQYWSCGVSALGVLLWSLYLPVSLSSFKYNGLSCDLILRNLWRVVGFSFYSPF